jgi:hypothetical protein
VCVVLFINIRFLQLQIPYRPIIDEFAKMVLRRAVTMLTYRPWIWVGWLRKFPKNLSIADILARIQTWHLHYINQLCFFRVTCGITLVDRPWSWHVNGADATRYDPTLNVRVQLISFVYPLVLWYMSLLYTRKYVMLTKGMIGHLILILRFRKSENTLIACCILIGYISELRNHL